MSMHRPPRGWDAGVGREAFPHPPSIMDRGDTHTSANNMCRCQWVIGDDDCDRCGTGDRGGRRGRGGRGDHDDRDDDDDDPKGFNSKPSKEVTDTS